MLLFSGTFQSHLILTCDPKSCLSQQNICDEMHVLIHYVWLYTNTNTKNALHSATIQNCPGAL